MVFFASNGENALSRNKLLEKDFYKSKISENTSFTSKRSISTNYAVRYKRKLATILSYSESAGYLTVLSALIIYYKNLRD